MLSQKFTEFQKAQKAKLPRYNSGGMGQSELARFLIEKDTVEEDIATFSQIGNIEIRLLETSVPTYSLINKPDYDSDEDCDDLIKQKYRRSIKLVRMETEVENEEPLSTQNSQVEMPEIDQDSQKISDLNDSSREPQNDNPNPQDSISKMIPVNDQNDYSGENKENNCEQKYTIAPYLNQNWTDHYAYELYTIELNKIRWKYELSTEEIMDLAFKGTADLDSIESYLKDNDTSKVWSRVEDIALINVMKERIIIENGGLISDEDYRDSYTTIEYNFLLNTKGEEQIKRRCKFLGIEFIE